MLLTIALILAAMIAVAALELWLFWRLGERDDVDASVFVGIEGAGAKERRTDTRTPRNTKCVTRRSTKPSWGGASGTG